MFIKWIAIRLAVVVMARSLNKYCVYIWILSHFGCYHLKGAILYTSFSVPSLPSKVTHQTYYNYLGSFRNLESFRLKTTLLRQRLNWQLNMKYIKMKTRLFNTSERLRRGVNLNGIGVSSYPQ